MPVNLKKDDMGDVIKDFYKSDAPQFKGKSKKKRRQMAIAAKLNAESVKVAEGTLSNVIGVVKKYASKKKKPAHKYPEGTKYKDPADAAKKKLKVRAQKEVGIFPDPADESPELSSSYKKKHNIKDWLHNSKNLVE